MSIFGALAGAAKAMLDRAALTLSRSLRARRRLLQEIVDNLEKIGDNAPRPKNREFLEFAHKNIAIIKSSEAKELILSAKDYNDRSKLNHFRDKAVLERICVELRAEINLII